MANSKKYSTYPNRLSFLVLLGIAIFSSCNDSNFTGGSGSKQSAGGNIKKKNPPPTKPVGDPGLDKDKDDLGFDTGKNCFKVQPTFHFMFVIDKTASMDSSILTVIKKVSSFSNKISSMTLTGATTPIKDSMFGAVTYIDLESENMYVDFTKDVADFSTKLNGHNIGTRGSGDDDVEGGLMAAKVGLNRLAASMVSGQNIVPVMVVISDNFSHDGIGGIIGRTFNDSIVVDAAKGDAFKPLLLIDATPKGSLSSGGRAGGSTFSPTGGPSPAAQWETIRGKIAAGSGRTAAAIGKGIDFDPNAGFDEAQLLNTIPALIQSSVKICE